MGRKIVICCDGTNNGVVGGTTNVLKLFGSVIRDDDQLAFYDSGVGTLPDPTRFTWLGRWWHSQVDMAIGHSLGRSVSAAYRFLVRHWREGDEIYLFGFSRGAFAVRALAGMVRFLGLLRPELESLDQLAWTVYADEYRKLKGKDRFDSGDLFAEKFSRVGSQMLPVRFLGVWDTVSSFGWIWDVRSLPHTAGCPNVQHIRHAVAIDETRAFFPRNAFGHKATIPDHSFCERWFAGVHSDVGGGYPADETGLLSRISLNWMLDEAESFGLRLERRPEDQVCAEPFGQGPNDALAKLNDSARGLWNLLEFVPRRRWDPRGQREAWFWPNMFRRRRIPERAVFHPSVLERMNVASLNYHASNMPKNPKFRAECPSGSSGGAAPPVPPEESEPIG